MTTLLIIIGMIAIVAAILEQFWIMLLEWIESRNQRRKRNRVNVLNGTTILSLELHFRRLIDEEGWD